MQRPIRRKMELTIEIDRILQGRIAPDRILQFPLLLLR